MKRIFLILFTFTALAANAQTGAQKQIGMDGMWLGATAATVLNDKLYTTEKNGTLVVTDLNTGMRKTVAKDGFTNNHFLFTSGGALYMIDYAGTLSKINHTTGTKEKLGPAASFAGMTTFGVIDGTLFGVDTKGDLISADLVTGDKTVNGGSNHMNVSLVFVVNEKMYGVEKSGALFEWALNGGTRHMLGKQGDYAASFTGVPYHSGLYLVTKAGLLTFTKTDTGERTVIGKPIYGLTKYIFGANGKLYTIESMGSLYEIVVK